VRARNSTIHEWCVAEPTKQREMLATTLTAIRTGNDVSSSMADPGDHSTINRPFVDG